MKLLNTIKLYENVNTQRLIFLIRSAQEWLRSYRSYCLGVRILRVRVDATVSSTGLVLDV